ncbi:MAG: NADH pyrophosphatase, partial [Xanthobacteraceae bacterium]
MQSLLTVPPRPDLGPPPQLGYVASRIDRAAGLRADAAALQKFSGHPRAAVYVVGGEMVVLKASSPACDPLF